MKKLLLTAALAAAAIHPSAQALSLGDFAFTAFNADEDGFSLVTFVNIAPNSTFYFADSAATSATAIGISESSFQWLTGASPIAAGTVVRFSTVDAAGRAASFGTFSVVNSSNLGLSATNETVYVFEGASDTAPTQFLSAATTLGNSSELTPAGLTAGTNAISLTFSTDFASYTGPRSGLASFADYLPLVNNPANWTINVGGDGAAVVPNTTAFTVVPEPGVAVTILGGVGMLLGFRRARRFAN